MSEVKENDERTLYAVGKEDFRDFLEYQEFDRVVEEKDLFMEVPGVQLPYVLGRFHEHLKENRSNNLGISVKPLVGFSNFKIDVFNIEPKQD